MNGDQSSAEAVELATELTIAWLTNPYTRAQAIEIPDFLRSMHEVVISLTAPPPAENTEQEPATTAEPAVTVRKSLASPEHVISLVDGKPYKSLKRHLSRHGLTPQEYLTKFGLKSDYPMVAPANAEKRWALAKSIRLGRKCAEGAESAPAPKKTRRRSAKAGAEVQG